MKSIPIWLARTLVVAFAVTLIGCGSGSDVAETYETPEQCFVAARQALIDQDYRKYAICLTPDSQAEMTAGIAQVLLIMEGKVDVAIAEQGELESFGELKDIVAAFYAVMDSHGIDPEALPPAADVLAGREQAEKQLRELVDTVTDKPRLLADLVGVFKEFRQFDARKWNRLDGEIQDITIQGDVATAELKPNRKGNNKGKYLNFQKCDGSWLIHTYD